MKAALSYGSVRGAGTAGTSRDVVQQQVGQVGVRRVLLQLFRERVADALCLPEPLAPLSEAAAVGEDDEATAAQHGKLFGSEAAAATRCQPKHRRMDGREDECRLLAFHEADGGVGSERQQVLTEEALAEHEVGRQQLLLDEPRVHPALVALTVALAVVLHDVAGAYAPLVVNLPEDDVAAPGGTDGVVVEHAVGIVPAEACLAGAVGREPLPEGAFWRVAFQQVLRVKRHQRFFLRWRAGRNFPFGGVAVAPRLVVVEVSGLVVVAATLFVVAASAGVVNIAAVVPRIDVAHEAALASAPRTGGLLLPSSRHFRGVQPVSVVVVVVHCRKTEKKLFLFIVLSGCFSFVVGAAIYIGGTDDKQKTIRLTAKNVRREWPLQELTE